MSLVAFQIFIRGSENYDSSRFFLEDASGLSWKFMSIYKMEIDGQILFSQHSTSLSGGNLVDGSPPARHTVAGGGSHGGWGQRLLGLKTFGKPKLERKSDFTLSGRSIGASDCIVRLLLGLISNRSFDEMMIPSWCRLASEGRKILIYAANCNFSEIIQNGMRIIRLGEEVKKYQKM